jgi:hypothetical protein
MLFIEHCLQHGIGKSGQPISCRLEYQIVARLRQYFHVVGNAHQNMKRFFALIIAIVSTTCNQTPVREGSKVMDLGSFTIETPQSWEHIVVKGIDSYVGNIAIDSTDTLSFDLGWYSNNLYEYEQPLMDSSLIESLDTNFVDPDAVIFVKSSTLVDRDKYRANNVTWDSIDGRSAKIVYPRRPGTGTTGIYIDSLRVTGTGIDRFNLYGTNLKPENERKVLAALKSLKFRTE